jgi:transcriptional regulator with XRE-family HTH domain
MKALRKKLGLTQKSLSETSGIGRTYIADVEAGRADPSFNFIKSLNTTFSVDINWLLSGESSMFLSKKDDAANVNAETTLSSTEGSPDCIEFFASAMAFAKELSATGTHDDRIRAAKFLKWAIEELEATEVERSDERRFDGAAG